MKLGNFIAKLLSLLLVIGFLMYYQSVAVVRAAAVEENEAAIAAVEAHNREVQQEYEALLRAADEAEAEAQAAEGPYVNGVYEGEGTGYGGAVRVRVEIVGGYIDHIEVTEHSGEDPAYYMLAESLVDAMVTAQSDQVDTVSGATFSSQGLIQAVGHAL
ncbi:MAG: FMN-binding protein [Oscillospiraceae bacterium]|nr:FMN-binding protein [Oscillospiraceae bacterium]